MGKEAPALTTGTLNTSCKAVVSYFDLIGSNATEQ